MLETIFTVKSALTMVDISTNESTQHTMNAQKMNAQKIAVLGLGAMGSRIAHNLINAGCALTVWNRSPQATEALKSAGATVATTPRQAAEQADIVISMVTDNNASKAVWLTPETGALCGLSSGKIAIAMSTLTIDWTHQLSERITEQGAGYLEAPVVGSRPQAEAKKLICLVGGKADALTQVRPVLEAITGVIHHVGGVGQGMAMKLAVNALFGIQVAALAELLAMLNQQGIFPKKSMSLLADMPVTSLAAKGIGSLIVAQKYDPLFPIHLVEKDFRYACETASKENLPATNAVRQIYRDAVDRGYGDGNINAIAQRFNSPTLQSHQNPAAYSPNAAAGSSC
ncbi:MAG: NAD(P)-dependent oxidoreductase [Cyanobacteria bacterium J06634_6]